jgi:dihydrofolate synthase/folylpolyglutamate synthase
VEWIRPTLEHTPGTTFEAITAIAFEHFQRHKVEVAVLEVGLGGRFDATNVVHPMASVITSIGMDHMNVLGNTLAQIAGEKAGIIKRGAPVVFTQQKESAAAVLAERARQRRARQVWVGRDWRWQQGSHTHEGQRFTLFAPPHGTGEWANPLQDLFIPLIGRHQLDNAAAAVAAVSEVRRRGFPVSEDALRRGLAEVQWPARLEVLQTSPWLLVDSAHTVESVEAAFATVQETLGRWPDAVIFGASADKDVAGMLRLIPPATRLVFSQAAHVRAMGVAELLKIAGSPRKKPVAFSSPRDALAQTLSEVGEDGIVLAFGSIFLAAEVREAWFEMTGRPLPPKDPCEQG